MARKKRTDEPTPGRAALPRGSDDPQVVPAKSGKPSALLDTRVIYCGDNLEQLKKLQPECVCFLSTVLSLHDVP